MIAARKVSLPPPGLSHAEAEKRLKLYGPNELSSERKSSLLKSMVITLQEPMLILLFACSGIYLLIGDISEGVLLICSALFVITLSLYQNRKSERALQALRTLSSPRALVIRDGVEKRIPSRDVVEGDVVVLNEGDRIPADALILSSNYLKVDESLVTGESVPVTKFAGIDKPSEGGRLYASTLVVKGGGLGLVTATGMRTTVGKIGKSLDRESTESSYLKEEMRALARIFSILGAFFCVIVILSYVFTRGDWPQAILAGLATAMSLLPEEIPVIMSVFLALGAWRLSKLKVLTRHPSAIERLGAISVLCVDKTGTLTENRMRVSELRTLSEAWHCGGNEPNSLAEEFHGLLEFGVLASQKTLFDPMEKALNSLLQAELSGTEHIHDHWQMVKEYPLSEKLLAMSCVWQGSSDSSFVIASKGAPEAIGDLCHLNSSTMQKVNENVLQMAKSGLRVLAVAKAKIPLGRLPDDPHDFDFQFLGLIGFEDPIRPEVPSAVEICHKAGIAVIMMTGDHAATAEKIAFQAGISPTGGILTGAEVAAMSDLELAEKTKQVRIFARMIPDLKLRIVNALKSNGDVVGMTGDGVNDAPSLKWADVGIAMGERGTDVAREASDLVLLDDNFASIVSGIAQGRRIFDNIRSALGFVFAVHVPIAGLALIPVLFGWPLLFFPAHIVFLEMIIDPACSLAFEALPAEASIMQRRPRPLMQRLISVGQILQNSLQGLIVLVVILIYYGYLIAHGTDTDLARTYAFILLIFSNLVLIVSSSAISILSLKQIFANRIAVTIVVLAIASMGLIIAIPALREMFSFSIPSGSDMPLLCFLAVMTGILIPSVR